MTALLWDFVLPVASAGLGTAAFCLLFHVATKHFLLCGSIGAAGWAVYLLSNHWLSVSESAFASTVAIVLLSRLCAIRNRTPVTIYLIPGIFPLVPGAGIYWTAYYFLTQQGPLAIGKGIETLQVAVAIVLGIVLIGEIPQKFFAKRKPRS